MKRYPLVIIGGGASGMMAGIAAAQAMGAGKVCILERGARVGRKLLATGNGRCNISNVNAAPNRYHGDDPGFTAAALRKYPVAEVIRRFREMGLLVTEEEDGKLYPKSYQAAAVLDIFRLELERAGAEVRTAAQVTAVEVQKKGGFTLRVRGEEGEEILFSETVIVACGGEASGGLGGCADGYALLKALGHTVTPRLPGIVQLKADMTGLKGLSGGKYEVAAELRDGKRVLRSESGELLFTDYGISGPPVMQLSAAASRLLAVGKSPEVTIDFLSWISFGETATLLRERKKDRPQKRLEDFFTGFLPKRLGQCVLKSAGIQPLSREAETLNEKEIKAVTGLLKSFPIRITGTNGMKNAQVTLGGAMTGEFDPCTMESRLIPGLYVTGELFDIDGDCGGYNLQWAWSSGLTAAESAVRAYSSARDSANSSK